MDSASEAPRPPHLPRAETPLNSSFQLFGPTTRSIPLHTPRTGNAYIDNITLQDPVLGSMLFESQAGGPLGKKSGGKIRREAPKTGFVPFAPEVGYSVTKLDASLETRTTKLEESIQTDPEQAAQHNLPLIIRTVVDPGSILPKTTENLRVMLSFPTMTLIGEPDKFGLEQGRIDFVYFYPVDTGPLPSNDSLPRTQDATLVKEGQRIFLPDDLTLLEQIHARFTQMKS